MAITVFAEGSGRSSGLTTSHNLGSHTINGGRLGIFMLMVSRDTIGPQPVAVSLSIAGNACTKLVSNTYEVGQTDVSIWSYRNTTGSNITGTVIATADNVCFAVISVATLTGFVFPIYGSTQTAEGLRYLYDEQSLTPTHISGVILGIGGTSEIGVGTRMDGTEIHNLYTYSYSYIGTHYKTFSGSAITSLKWDWDDADKYQNWNVCMLEITENSISAPSDGVLFRMT